MTSLFEHLFDEEGEPIPEPKEFMADSPLRLPACDNCGTDGMEVEDALNLYLETRFQFVCRECGEVIRVNRHLETGEERLRVVVKPGTSRKGAVKGKKSQARTSKRDKSEREVTAS